MGSEGDEPHVERDAEKGDGEEDTKKTEFAKPHRTLNWLTFGRPPHFLHLELIHADALC